MQNIEIRPLTAAEWPQLKALRITALRDSPGVYDGTLETALARTPEEWHALIAGDDRLLVGLFDGARLIGIAGIFTDQNDASGGTAMLGMGFILPDYRGRGLSHRMFEMRLAWARSHPQLKQVRLEHRSSNAPMRRLALHYGFIEQERQMRAWPDGSEGEETIYHLPLR